MPGAVLSVLWASSHKISTGGSREIDPHRMELPPF